MSPSARPAIQSAAASPASPSAPPEPAQCPKCQRETKVDVTKCHACHMKRRWMPRIATPATQCAAASPATNAVQARHQSQPAQCLISAAPGTQNQSRCHQVPRLPPETKVDVTNCDACHAKCRGVTGDQSSPSAPPEPSQCPKCRACDAKQK